MRPAGPSKRLRIPVHVLHEGYRRRALLVHGAEDSWRSWAPISAVLGADVTCLAPDLPWRAGNDYTWSHRGRADDFVGQLLEETGPVELLIGHSFGATAALGALTGGSRPQHPPVGAVVLIAPLYCPPDLPVTWELFDRSRAHYEAVIRAGVRLRLGARADRLGVELTESIVAKALDRIGPLGFMTMFQHFVASAVLPLPDLAIPCLVLGGSGDPSVSGGRAAALATKVDKAVLRVRDEWSHFCHVDAPEQVADEIAQFVRTEPESAVNGKSPQEGVRT